MAILFLAAVFVLAAGVSVVTRERSTLAVTPNEPFSFLAPGFTQSLYGVSPSFLGGVAFAPDGDPWADECVFGGGALHRFDQQTVITVSGTAIHPQSAVPSNAGCGLTNHPNGSIYASTGSGITRLDANSGAQIGAAMGSPANVLGIATDPVTSNVVYLAADCRFTGTCTVLSLDPSSGVSTTFATLPGLNFIDGIYFNPDGSKLFMSTRSPSFEVTVLNRDGTIDRHIPLPSEPDGIAFHLSGLVITNNTDGTMSAVDVSTSPPTVSLFASGGFRGDLTQVGPDGCLYATQAGTRYRDGTVTGENSVVRICPDFAPPPGVSRITLTPLTATLDTGSTHTVTARVTDFNSNPLPGVTVDFTVSGANTRVGSVATNAGGTSAFSYVGTAEGLDTVRASASISGQQVVSNNAFATWRAPVCGSRLIVFVRGISFDVPWNTDRGQRHSAIEWGSGFSEMASYLKSTYGYRDSDFRWFNYAGGDGTPSSEFNAADTRQTIFLSALNLNSQIRMWSGQCPNSQLDIIAHSLGGAVVSYWAGWSGSGGGFDSVGKVHAVLTFESPLGGIPAINCSFALLASDLNVVAGLVGADLCFEKDTMKHGLERVPTLAFNNWADPIVNGCVAQGMSRADGFLNGGLTGRLWDSRELGVDIYPDSFAGCLGILGVPGLSAMLANSADNHGASVKSLMQMLVNH
jgi:hypothetical protein